jgi:PAS domain S-box-containing protein
MKRESVVQVVVGFFIGAVLLSLLSYMEKIVIGIDPLQARGYFVPILFGGTSAAIITYLLRTEIVERQRAEEALKESKTRLSTILSSMDDLVFVFDHEGRFTDCYAPVGELRLSPEQFLGKRHAEVVVPYIDRLFSWAFEKTKMGDVAEYEYWLDVDGGREWYSVKLSPMVLEGEFVGAVSVMRDITERKRAEEAVQESEEEYRTLVEQLPYGLAVVQDTPLRLIFANSALARGLGYTVERLLSLSPEATMALVHSEDWAGLFQHYRSLLAGQPQALRRYEFRAVRRDGALRWLEVSADHIEYRGSSAVRAVFLDVTARRCAEEALQESEERCRVLLERADGALFSGVESE